MGRQFGLTLFSYKVKQVHHQETSMISPRQRLPDILSYCQNRGIKLTALRQSIYSILYEAAKPISAYDVLRVLKNDHPQAEAMTVYRILTFLEEKHLIHRIARTNTYAVCDMLMHEHHAQLLLCDTCGQAKEIKIEQLESILASILKQHHFKPSSKPIEISGICESCQLMASNNTDGHKKNIPL